MKKLTQAEADAAVETLNDAADRAKSALQRISDLYEINFVEAIADIDRITGFAKFRIRGFTEKETEN